ncbi:MAG: biopolymer transporter ExbD [Chitinophagaceae bacterium]|nr:biopolymer transporter ExbD [Chitinophagaceae bacterium]
MGRAKLPRKSTAVDMTAMCDVAFLLLAFFILTTKFKPEEAITVVTPNSVSAKPAEEKDFVIVTIDATGKVFLSMDDEEKKEYIANSLNQTKNLGLDVNAFKKASFFGTPFSSLKSYLALEDNQRKGALLPGIPIDTVKGNNEMIEWMQLIATAYQGLKLRNLYVKGDNNSKYPSFEAVIEAFKKNDFMKFQMITNPEAVPVGSEYFKLKDQGGNIEE